MEAKDLRFADYLRGIGMEIIPIDAGDEMHHANNYLTVSPRKIVAVKGYSNELKHRFHDAGVSVEDIPLDNIIRGYGAAHCMTQVLSREL